MSPTNAKPLPLVLRLVIAICFAALGLLQCPSAVSRPQNSPPSPLRSPHAERGGFVGDLACRPCHQDKTGSYLATAHHRTSRLPDVSSIAGSFTKGKDVMTTLNPDTRLKAKVRNHWIRVYQKPSHP